MATQIQISSSNYTGQIADITFYPCYSGAPISLGQQVIPYTYTNDNYQGNYNLYFSAYNSTCQLNILCPTPTPTPTNTSTPTLTPTPTQTSTPSSTPAVTPTPTATTPPFSPSGVTGLQFWFLSNSGSSVSSWTNYGLLGGSVVQSNASYQPQVLTGATLGTYTGTAMRFANRDFMTGSTTSTSFSAETTFIVLKRVYATNLGWAITMYNTTGSTSYPTNYVWNYNSFQFPDNASSINAKPTLVTMPLYTNCLISSSGNSSSLSATTNGSYTGSTASLFTGSTNVVRLDIGYDPGYDEGQTHDVFEFISYNRILTSTEYNNVMNYLKTKYQYSSW
jgi:hypothetical protein